MDVTGVANNTAFQPIMPSVSAGAQSAPAPAPVHESAEAVPERPVTTSAPGNSPGESAEAANVEKQSEPVSNEFLEKTINQVNKSLNSFDRELQINVHKKTGRIMVKVMDTDEGRVIREIPPEKVLDAFARTLEMAGILIDKKR